MRRSKKHMEKNKNSACPIVKMERQSQSGNEFKATPSISFFH